MNFIQKAVLTVLPCAILSLPTGAMANDNVDNFLEKINTLQNQTSSMADSLLSKAKTLIGTPYRLGGTTPSGFDCSGFMQYVFNNAGISLPRTSRDMATVGTKVGRDALQVGDMLFFAHSGKRISHVGMYVGEGKFIHSPSTGKTVEITNLDSKYWAGRFITARRVLND
ncbi:nlpC/p60 family protein [Moraxella macacae 0408225]|uniref:NlpC/p60 family protein n=1 Tax=Moraxella macacae 0408225 TaxID=1230338 RepID=L2F585_9GAMM|nr:C40 family peptidase [Moraxella macacae]ELA08182.1 nlpC/p60 family protein [Moraxella macacae 0408225]